MQLDTYTAYGKLSVARSHPYAVLDALRPACAENSHDEQVLLDAVWRPAKFDKPPSKPQPQTTAANGSSRPAGPAMPKAAYTPPHLRDGQGMHCTRAQGALLRLAGPKGGHCGARGTDLLCSWAQQRSVLSLHDAVASEGSHSNAEMPSPSRGCILGSKKPRYCIPHGGIAGPLVVGSLMLGPDTF